MGWGDELVAAGQAQRVYDADPSMRVAICDHAGRVRWHDLWEGNPIIAPPLAVTNGERVHRITSGPGCRPYIQYPFTKDSGWTFNRAFRCREHPASIYLTPDEWARGTKAQEKYGPYVLIEPFTKHANFRWHVDRWTDLVLAMPHVMFVQHTHSQSPGIPLGDRMDVERATFREAIGLIYGAACYVRSESGLCHAAGALGIPQVTLFGGCMDPEVMGYYPGQTVIADDEPGSPCGSWNPCAHCAAAMDRITVATVVDALESRLRRRAA